MRLLCIFFFVILALPNPVLAYSTLDLLREKSEYTTLTVGTSPVDVGGIPRGASRVKVLPLHLQASCGSDVRIMRIRLKLEGLGDANDVQRVYLIKGFQRLSRPTRFNSDREADIRLRNFIVPACRTVKVDVAADFDPDAAAGGQFIFTLNSRNAIFTDANEIQGAFPVHTQPARSSITPNPVGKITVSFLPIASIRPVQNEILAKMSMKADTEANQILRSITLTNTGTAKDDDLRNLYLTRHNGRALTPLVKQMSGDTVTLRFSSPYLVKRGQQLMFQLRGNAYTARKTVNFTLEEPSDLSADSSRRGTRDKVKWLQ